jgi:hypothetical protein
MEQTDLGLLFSSSLPQWDTSVSVGVQACLQIHMVTSCHVLIIGMVIPLLPIWLGMTIYG